MKTVTTVEVTCCECGTVFGMEEPLQEMRTKDGKKFFCPNGHGQWYTKSTSAKLEESKTQLEETKKELQDCQVEIRRLKCELLKNPKKPNGFWHRVFSKSEK